MVGADGATLSAQPAGETGRALSVGTTLTAKGRSGDGGWLYVESGDGASGWVATDAVVAFNVRGLPILDAAGAVAAVEVPPSDEPTAAGEDVDGAATSPEASGGGEDELAMTVTGAVTVTVAMTTTPPVAATPALRTVAADNEQPTARIAMSGSRLNVRAGPGVQYAIIDKALPNETFIALARNGPADWVHAWMSRANARAQPGQRVEPEMVRGAAAGARVYAISIILNSLPVAGSGPNISSVIVSLPVRRSTSRMMVGFLVIGQL